MDKSDFAGFLILLVCAWGCGAVFYGIGLWAARRKTPMFFWAGSEVDPQTVSDIPAYNRENGRMWKQYSFPFWLAGALGIGGLWYSWCNIAVLVLLVLACTVGMWWLIHTYGRIRKRYLIPAPLDKADGFC